MEDEKKLYKDLLYKTILSFNCIEEIEQFFGDLLSDPELDKLITKLMIAKRRCDGKTYKVIASELSVSNSTIVHVKECLESSNNGIARALNCIYEKENAEIEKANYANVVSMQEYRQAAGQI